MSLNLAGSKLSILYLMKIKMSAQNGNTMMMIMIMIYLPDEDLSLQHHRPVGDLHPAGRQPRHLGGQQQGGQQEARHCSS